jgi:glycosyltransferase involved in cell wall biosynthesis
MKASKVIFIQFQKGSLVNEDASSAPLVSFLIPTLDSEQTLERCLDSIAKQDYPFIEMVIVDNGSTDDSMTIARRFGARIYSLKGPLGEVRRLGITKCCGELVALWDSDLYIPHTRWLSQGVNVLCRFSSASTLWVRTTSPPKTTMLARAYDWHSWATMLNFAKKGVGSWGGGASIFKKKTIMEVGGITQGIDTGEDYDLATKIAEKGYSVLFYNDPIYHDSHATLAELINKDVRRAENFKKKGLTSSTGIPLTELIAVNLKIGLVESLRCLFAKKEPYFALVPVIVLVRMITYVIAYLLT